MEIGTNLTGITYWTSAQPFLNLFYSSGSWQTQPRRYLSASYLDSDGWIKRLPEDGDGGHKPAYTTLSTGKTVYKARKYAVLYEGKGTIQYTLDAKKVNQLSKPGIDVIQVKPSKKGIGLKITSTDPKDTGDYIRNIRVVPLENKNNYATQIFNPLFLNKFEDFSAFRFMNWMYTNHTNENEWDERPTLDDSSFFKRGVPVELMVELANKTNVDPWFNMPYQASDDYVENFALYVKEHLKSNLKVYVEYTNEAWNHRYPQYNYSLQQGKKAFPSLKPKMAVIDWFSKRTTEVTQIWDDVFAAQKKRVIGVMATRGNDPEYTKRLLDYAWTNKHPTNASLGIDAIAMNNYFGYYIGKRENAYQLKKWTKSPDGGLKKLFDEITQGGVLKNGPKGGALQEAEDLASAQMKIAKKENLELLSYEGGQHLVGVRRVRRNKQITNLFIKANRDPRMGEVYKQHFKNWHNLGGGTFMNFTDIYEPTQNGSWGLLENIYQNSSPKYKAILDLIT